MLLRSPHLLAVTCLLAACSRRASTSPPERAADAADAADAAPPAPDWDDAALRPGLQAELTAALARHAPVLPAGAEVRLGGSQYLASADLPHSITVDLRLPVPDDALARETMITLGIYSIEPNPTQHVVSRPDYPSLMRHATAIAPRALAVLGVARGALKGLSVYRGWQQRRRAYRTYLLPMRDDLDAVQVYFSTSYVEGDPDPESPVQVGVSYASQVANVRCGAGMTECTRAP